MLSFKLEADKFVLSGVKNLKTDQAWVQKNEFWISARLFKSLSEAMKFRNFLECNLKGTIYTEDDDFDVFFQFDQLAEQGIIFSRNMEGSLFSVNDTLPYELRTRDGYDWYPQKIPFTSEGNQFWFKSELLEEGDKSKNIEIAFQKEKEDFKIVNIRTETNENWALSNGLWSPAPAISSSEKVTLDLFQDFLKKSEQKGTEERAFYFNSWEAELVIFDTEMNESVVKEPRDAFALPKVKAQYLNGRVFYPVNSLNDMGEMELYTLIFEHKSEDFSLLGYYNPLGSYESLKD